MNHLGSCTGGESTFIIVNGQLSNILIAAGSGGGVGYWKGIENPGGYGGYIGQNGQDFNYNTYHAGGGTQNKSGSGSHFTDPAIICDSFSGDFLTGGNANGCAWASSGGGGGGYYGGGGGVDVGGGGGGSSFARSDLQNITFFSGNETFESPSGTLEKGHAGDGLIIIQYLSYYSNIRLYFKTNLSWLILISFFNS